MTKSRVLVVDDEPGMLEVCTDILVPLPEVEVVTESDSQAAAERLSSEDWDLLIADIRMPGIGGVDLLRIAREHDPGMLVLMITAFPSIQTAVESMKLGATDYITKPFLPEDLRATVRRLLEEKCVRDEHRFLQRQMAGLHRMGEMLGKCPPMQAVFAAIERIAPTDLDVLILGETGTGKELVARTIHQLSARREQRFVPVDCGAIPEELLESEFFGHERGAFTGANTRSLGLLEFAHNGTFFLDEIGHLPQKLQAKLLRALQERRIRRVGANQEVDVNVRVIAASSLDLEEEVRQQRFRMDLYYRINVAPVKLPPLRERLEDIPLLATHFAARYAPEIGRKNVAIHPEALEVLCGYRWPGNVRELQNAIRRALVTASGDEIELGVLPDEVISTAGEQSGKNNSGFFGLREQYVARFERQYLENLLKSHQGDVGLAARSAQLPRGTLYRLLKKHDLIPIDYRA